MGVIKQNDTLIAMRSEDHQVIAYKLGTPTNEGETAIAAMTASGAIAMKVTSMTQQDEIGLPVKGCDGVTVAVKGGGTALGMIMVFIDEANSVYAPNGQAAWDDDVVWWNALVDEYGPPEHAAVHKVDGQSYDIIPDGRSCPPEIQYSTIARNPSGQQMIDAYNNCKGGSDKPHPQEVVICVDNSGSMTRSTMTPGIDEFETWLNNGGTSTPDPANPLEPIQWREVSFSNERWLNLTCEWYEEYRQQQAEGGFDG